MELPAPTTNKYVEGEVKVTCCSCKKGTLLIPTRSRSYDLSEGGLNPGEFLDFGRVNSSGEDEYAAAYQQYTAGFVLEVDANDNIRPLTKRTFRDGGRELTFTPDFDRSAIWACEACAPILPLLGWIPRSEMLRSLED